MTLIEIVVGIAVLIIVALVISTAFGNQLVAGKKMAIAASARNWDPSIRSELADMVKDYAASVGVLAPRNNLLAETGGTRIFLNAATQATDFAGWNGIAPGTGHAQGATRCAAGARLPGAGSAGALYVCARITSSAGNANRSSLGRGQQIFVESSTTVIDPVSGATRTWGQANMIDSACRVNYVVHWLLSGQRKSGHMAGSMVTACQRL